MLNKLTFTPVIKRYTTQVYLNKKYTQHILHETMFSTVVHQ